MRVAASILPARAASSVIHDHFRLQRLVYHVGVAAWPAASDVHVSTALLAVSRLLECTAGATWHHIGLVRIRHVIVFLLAKSLATVRGHRPSRRAIDHAAAVAGIRQRVIGRALIVHRLILSSSETTVDALANHLVERAAHLLLGFVVVDHALRVRFAGRAEIVLVIAAVAGALREYRISRALVVGHLLHEVVVLGGEVVALVARGRVDAVGLLTHFLDAGR